jgi:hypothetical protein
MKKLLLLILLLILIVGCGEKPAEPVIQQQIPEKPVPEPVQEVKKPESEPIKIPVREPVPKPEPLPKPTPEPEPETIIPPTPECYQNSDCMHSQICQNDNCIDIDCGGYCKTIINHQCFTLNCCSDNDCDDNDQNTEDACVQPMTTDSHCVNTVIETPEPENDSCTYDTECPAGKFCMATRTCVTPTEFFSQNPGCCEQGMTVTINQVDYSDCGYMATLTSNIANCSQISCPNCDREMQVCAAHPKGLAELPFYNYCTECLSNYHCKEGYVCENRLCVAS